ncbi:response regulator [Oceaniglobus trochenteri]|uniref:response regulator n=1 Tax=Oceaniglobus trochenteri TaxID=2763260 RepID=UPI001CFFCA62|nr:response regulator [Oceaniglobus trochenteri]
MKILAIDDDSFIVELLTMICNRIGFSDVQTGLSGEEALRMIGESEQGFDCFLLDINMPQMDGIELCARIRALPGHEKTPIIMLTAMTERHYIDRAFKAGATDYATKPIDMIELRARLRMAEEVVTARNLAAIALAAEVEDTQGPPVEKNYALDDLIEVGGFADLIDYAALANYLLQLSRAGLVGSQVLAISIDRIDEIYARASLREFTHVLTEVARAVNTSFGEGGYMMAYAGTGTFVLISGKATLEPSIGLENEIQGLLDGRRISFDNGEAIAPEISIGNPIRPNASKTQRIRRTFDRAIARAQNRGQKKASDGAHPADRLASR